MLDYVYSNIKHGFKAAPLPHLGQSDHILLFLYPAYRPLINSVKPVAREIRVWPEKATKQLQDCFDRNDWS